MPGEHPLPNTPDIPKCYPSPSQTRAGPMGSMSRGGQGMGLEGLEDGERPKSRHFSRRRSLLFDKLEELVGDAGSPGGGL